MRIAIPLLFAALIAAPSYAQTTKANPAFRHGLWVCSMPAPASYLDAHFTDSRGMIEFSYQVLDGLADQPAYTKGFCHRVNADNLKISGFDPFWKVAIITDGKKQGYVGMLSYANYMAFHSVASSR